MSEFTDLITISQMPPGPIAVNSAIFVGLKIAGVLGAVVVTFGCILPSCIIVTVLAKLYLKYRSMDMMQEVLHSLRPAVVAMIASAGILILMTAFWGNGTVTFVKTKWAMVLIAENKDESYLGHGVGRDNESNRIVCINFDIFTVNCPFNF